MAFGGADRYVEALGHGLRRRHPEVIRAQHLYDINSDRVLLRVTYRGDRYRQFAFSAMEAMHGEGRRWAQMVFEEVARDCAQYSEPSEALIRIDTLYGYGALRPELAISFGDSVLDSKAEATAEKLFKESAPAAYKALCKRGWAEIVGSLGTNYQLHKRATYCVENPSIGKKLCVVVPGVPLWDHLLGVKLMVEHDEPQFLKTANVAHA